MEANDLKAACRKFEHEHGVEAFLDAIAGIMPTGWPLIGCRRIFSMMPIRGPTRPPAEC